MQNTFSDLKILQATKVRTRTHFVGSFRMLVNDSLSIDKLLRKQISKSQILDGNLEIALLKRWGKNKMQFVLHQETWMNHGKQ